jgi:hypothetical protein
MGITVPAARSSHSLELVGDLLLLAGGENSPRVPIAPFPVSAIRVADITTRLAPHTWVHRNTPASSSFPVLSSPLVAPPLTSRSPVLPHSVCCCILFPSCLIALLFFRALRPAKASLRPRPTSPPPSRFPEEKIGEYGRGAKEGRNDFLE